MKALSEKVRAIPVSATVGIADTAYALRRAGHKVIDFSAGRAAETTPLYITDAAFAAARAGATSQTLARGTSAYREACAAMLQRDFGVSADPETEIIASMGIKQAQTVAFMALLNPGDTVIVEDPCFVSYEPIINVCGGKVIRVPLLEKNRFRWTAKQLEAAVTPSTKAILLCSPHNPTGVVHTREDLEVIAAVAQRHDLWVVTDEIYAAVAWGGRRHLSMATLPGMRDRTVTAMGLTKTFAMGGWRIGFLLAPPDVSASIHVLQQHLITCASSIAQAGGTAAFNEPPREEVRLLWREWEERCRFFTTELDALPGIRCPMPEGGFYAWADITGTGLFDTDFALKLLRERHVAVVPGSAFGSSGKGYVRFTCVRSRPDLEEGLNRIKTAVRDWHRGKNHD